MDFQQISALIFVLLATGYTLYKLTRILFPGKSANPANLCPGCSGACHAKKTLYPKKFKPYTLHLP